MTNILPIEKGLENITMTLEPQYLVTEYNNLDKRKNRFKRNSKEEFLDISPKTLVGSSLSLFSDVNNYNIFNNYNNNNNLILNNNINLNQNEENLDNNLKKNYCPNSKLALLDDISNNSKSTNINHLTNLNKELSGNLEFLSLNNCNNTTNISNINNTKNVYNNNFNSNINNKKRVRFRDEIKIQTEDNNYNFKSINVRMPLVDVIDVESFKKYNFIEMNNFNKNIENNNNKSKFSFKKSFNHLTCNALNNPCCQIF